MSGRFVRRLRIAAAAAGGVALLIVLALWGVAHSGRFDAWLTSALTVRLAPWIRFSAAHVEWWPRPAVVFDDVEVAARSDPPPPGVASAATLTCRIRLAALLAREVEIGAVRIDGLHLIVVHGADGRLHAGGLDNLMAARPGATSSAAPMPVVNLRESHVEYRLDQAGTAAGVHALDARLTPSGEGAEIELSGDVDDGGSVRIRGTIATLTDIAAAHFNATIDATDIDATALLAIAPPIEDLSVEGRLRVSATVSGRGINALDGKGTVELADGSVSWLEWQTASPLHAEALLAWDGTRLTVSQGRLEAARLECGALEAESIQAGFAYADRVLTLDSAELRSCNGTWRSSGRVALVQPPHIEGIVQGTDVDAAELVRILNDFGVTTTLPELSAPLRLNVQGSGSAGAWSGHAGLQTDGTLTFANARLEGPIDVSADAAVDGADATLSNGSATVHRVAIGALAADSVAGTFSLGRGTATITSLSGNAFGGRWAYSGTVPVNTTAAWRGELTGTQIGAAALHEAFGSAAANVDGSLDVRAQLSGTGNRSADGTVTARLSSPQLTWDEIQIDGPADVSLPLQLRNSRVSVANARARIHRVHAHGVAVKGINAAFGFADPNLRITDLDAQAFGGRWQANGVLKLGAPPIWNGSIAAQHIDFGALLDELDPAVGGPSSTDGIADLSVRITRGDDDDAAGSVALTLLSGAFFWDDLHVNGPAQAKSGFAVRNGALNLTHATASAAHAQYGPIAGSNAGATFDLAGQRLTFADLHFDSCGGKWTYKGYFTLAPAGPFSGQIVVAGANPGQVFAMLDQEATQVSFDSLDFDSLFASHAADDWLAEMRATGSVFLSGGTMHSATVLRPIVEGLVGSGRIMNAMSRPTTHVQELSETFTLRNDRFDTSDFALITDDYSVTGAGSVGIDGSVDLNTRIQLTSLGVQKMFILGSLPLPTSALPSLPPIPAQVTGSLENLIVRPNVSALPRSTVEWLIDALLQAPRTIGESVVHSIGRLWGGARRLVGAGD